MKTYRYNIAIVSLLIMFVSNVSAQNSADYKHPFSKAVQSTTSSRFEIGSPGYSSVDNYKHPQYMVRIVESKVQIPECCSKVRVSTLNSPDYKHPYTKFTGKTCGLGYVCKDRVKLQCCL
jgi:hypothetical protein